MPGTYDSIPYRGSPYAQTHPSGLCTLATLFGMKPAPVKRCRVLEVGCGDAENLIPMALALPDSHFVGIDLAPEAIKSGRDLSSQLRLTNIDLYIQDVTCFGEDWGKFDYIIIHGLYSWVSESVRESLLRVAHNNLAPQGVAYISYLAHPGGYLRKMIREMIRFHVHDIGEPLESVAQASELLSIIASWAPARAGEYGGFVAKALKEMMDRDPGHCFHDELGEIYEPFFVHEFLAAAGRHGLQYLSEARFRNSGYGAAHESFSICLDALSNRDRVLREQYSDFLTCRDFRETLLCRADVHLSSEPVWDTVRDMSVSSAARLIGTQPDGSMVFQSPDGVSMTSGHEITNALIVKLMEMSPEFMDFSEIKTSIGPHGSEQISRILSVTFSAGITDLHCWHPEIVRAAGPYPTASPLARMQVRSHSTVTTLRHTSVEAKGQLVRALIALMDGTRDRDALRKELAPLRGDVDEGTFADQLESNLAKAGSLALLTR